MKTLIALLLALLPAAFAQDWGQTATVSSTMGVQANRICVGEGSRGDIGCPTYAPTVSTTGNLGITAGLTVNSVSLTTASTTWGYFGNTASYLPNLVTGAVSTTNISLSTINGMPLSSFTNGSATIVSGTTTMLAGWPDAIMCTDNGGSPAPTGRQTVFWQFYREGSSNTVSYAWVADTVTYSIQFNVNGTYNTKWNSGSQSDTTDCEGKSISQLYAEGKAFNFIGNSGMGGNGFAITSGTLSVTTNSATSVVSLTTAGTTWGYFGNAASYLPNLAAGGVSATTISATNVNVTSRISAATLQLKPNAADACNSSNAGTIKLVNGRPYICRSE